MQSWKAQHPCFDCGVFYPYWVMEFDHVPGTKRFNLGTEGKRLDEETLRREMAMCDVVCCNCHAERTYRRLKK